MTLLNRTQEKSLCWVNEFERHQLSLFPGLHSAVHKSSIVHQDLNQKKNKQKNQQEYPPEENRKSQS